MIDGSLNRPWPQDVQDALEKFKQGHLVEQPPFLYAADLARPLHALTAETARQDQDAGEEITAGELLCCEAEPDSCPPFGIITTQTCDIAEQGTPAQPWLQVAPVYQPHHEGDGPFPFKAYFAELDAPTFAGALWIADLRLEVPVEKSVLAGREPIEAFATEQGYLEFADRLGRRRARAALADALDRSIVNHLRRRLGRNQAGAQQARTWTYGLRIRIVEGERLTPAVAQLYVVLSGPRVVAADDEREAVPDDVVSWYESWWDTASERAGATGIRLLRNEYLDAGRVEVELYDRLIELDIGHAA